ncbi:MAG: hypothetical protein O3B01_16980 [Planctomycetota bacterium]|nr:hypothetical protein [Planctomycetota bacterium]
MLIFALTASLIADQTIELTLKSGTTLIGIRLTFEGGQFQLFQAEKVVPISVDYGEVQSVSIMHPPKKSQSQPFRVPPIMRPLTEDKFNELEKALLAGEDIPAPFHIPKDRSIQSRLNLMRMAQIANYHIEHDQLDEAVSKYAKSIRREGPVSTADEGTWLLYLFCLERQGDKELLRREVAVYKARYGEEIPLSRFFEKAGTGENGGGRR